MPRLSVLSTNRSSQSTEWTFGQKGIPVEKPTPGVKQYTWQEVAEHNSEAKGVWVAVGRKVYDITGWLNSHPGGKTFLMLSAGRDITDLFHSYHPFTDKPSAVLSKFEIGELSTFEFPQYSPDSGFYRECCDRVFQYFKQTGLHYKDPIPGLVRLSIFLTAAVFFFLMAFNVGSFDLPLWGRWLCACAFGVCQALPLLHCMVCSLEFFF